MTTPKYIVGIGSSLGGLEGLKVILKTLPSDINAALIIIHHLPFGANSSLDSTLYNYSPLKLLPAANGQKVESGCIYLLEGSKWLTITDGYLTVIEHNHTASNHSIDVFLYSLAKSYKNNAISVILSGVGTDGASGVKHIHDNGGKVLIQSPISSESESMPKAAISIDDPNYILPPLELAIKLVDILSEI